MPSLELSVAGSKRFCRWWVSVVVIAWSMGREALDSVVIVSLITLTNKSDIRRAWDAWNISLLEAVNSDP